MNGTVDEAVGSALKQRRLTLGLDLADLAVKTGVSELDLARFESGAVRVSAEALLLIFS